MFDFEDVFPIQHHNGTVFAIRYRYLPPPENNAYSEEIKHCGLSIEKMDIQSSQTYDTIGEAIEQYINYALSYGGLNNKYIIEKDDKMPFMHIIRASTEIARMTRRAGGNILIGNSKYFTEEFLGQPVEVIETKCQLTGSNILEGLPFTGVSSPSLRGRFICLHKDLGNKILVGYTGKRVNDTGIVIGMINGKYTVTSNIVGTDNYYTLIEVEGDNHV